MALFPFSLSAEETDVFEGLVDEKDVSGAQPRSAPPSPGVAPLTSRMTLNGTRIEYGDEWITDFQVDFGNRRNTYAGGEANFVAENTLEQGIQFRDGGVFYERDQSSWVVQLRGIDRRRTVTSTRIEGGELVGFNLDLSLTGKCFLPGSPSDSYCTYTPGISTVPGGYDKDSLAPNAFAITTDFGEVIAEEVHRSIQTEERFQRGEDVAGAGLVGLHFDVPNAGFISTVDSLDRSGADRREEVQRRFVPSIAKLDQKLVSSSREAAATRTVRAFVLPEASEWDRGVALMQLAAWFLPTASASVESAPGAPRLNVSNNLFHALNNAWTPSESFTVFQTGRAHVVHASTPPTSASETPRATYTGVWMGLTPIRDTRLEVREQFIPSGDRISVGDPIFRQGGNGIDIDDIVDPRITVFDGVGLGFTDLNFQNIDDLFVQVGLDVTSQEAVRRVTAVETSRYRLVPHLSFNGNVTGGESVLRYYGGAIFGDETNGYVGADYTLATEGGWNGYARLDLYSNPDRDYFSEAELRVSRTLTLNADRQFTFGIGGVAAIDGLTQRTGSSALELGERDRRVDLVGRWREGPFDLTLRQRFAKSNDDEWRDSSTFGVSYAPDNRLFISAQATPFSEEDAYIEGALAVNWRVNEDPSSPILQFQYARAKYELGATAGGDKFSVTENTIRAAFQARF